MTPQEKAKELYLKFYIPSYCYAKEGMPSDWKQIASKRNAINVVDKIIKSNPSYPYDIQFDVMPHFRSLKYWQEVKSEIEKL